MIKSRSLSKSNIIFAFKEPNTPAPENREFVGLYTGDRAQGVQLVDDPTMRMKILDIPKLGLQIAWESRRFRIDDMKAIEPDTSVLIEEAVHAYETICSPRKMTLEGFGFNIEVYYQTSDVIRINDHMNAIMQKPIYFGDTVLDFGWQWTVAKKNGKQTDAYFLKVTAPLEFIVHHNAHFVAKDLPPKKELQEVFEAAYLATHAMADTLNI